MPLATSLQPKQALALREKIFNIRFVRRSAVTPGQKKSFRLARKLRETKTFFLRGRRPIAQITTP
jgi:hypothetical protein